MSEQELEIKIEKNIPLIRKTRKKSGCKYDFLNTMEIGDSFLYPYSFNKKKSFYDASHRRNIKVSIRIVNMGKDMRIWRVK